MTASVAGNTTLSLIHWWLWIALNGEKHPEVGDACACVQELEFREANYQKRIRLVLKYKILGEECANQEAEVVLMVARKEIYPEEDERPWGQEDQ